MRAVYVVYLSIKELSTLKIQFKTFKASIDYNLKKIAIKTIFFKKNLIEDKILHDMI